MFKYLIRLNKSSSEIKRNKRKQLFGESSFFIGKKIMEEIEGKLDQMATYLAELMLSQLGFSFIPSVRPDVIQIQIGGIFTVPIGFPKDEILEVPYFYYEPLVFTVEVGNDGSN